HGLDAVDALVARAGGSHMVVYTELEEADAVATLLEHGVDEVFDAAIFDPRVVDQVFGQLIEKTLQDAALLDMVMSRDALLAHRRERERRLHRIRSALLAITLEPLPLETAIDRVLGVLFGDDGPGEFQTGLCFLYDAADGGCRLVSERGVEAHWLSHLKTLDLSDCLCRPPFHDARAHFEKPDATAPPPCQEILGHHAGYVVTLLDHAREPLGSLSIWVPPDMPRADDVALLVEDAARILSTIIAHHRQVDRIRLLHQVVEQSPLSVLITDPEGRITYANPQLYRLTGYRPDEVLGQNPRLFNSGLVSDETFQEMWTMLVDGDVWEGELINRKKDGELFTEQAIISPVTDAGGRVEGYVAVKRDITLELRFKAQLEHQATHDPLTDLANRGLLGDRVTQAINYARRHDRLVVALLIDLDDFSSVNENHGAAAGDAVLREVAERLTGQARDYDTVARLGNDEFIVILGDVVEERFVLELAGKYLGVFEKAFDTGTGRVVMTASMGVATYPLDSRDGDELLRHATMALARQRNVGPGGYSLFGQ
ncbi:MAG: diguanylate cyclase, partial [Gammaproteobacteria bacterium]|nr:diguanylate cyclase [Gammaproteobacteria bacterium]